MPGLPTEHAEPQDVSQAASMTMMVPRSFLHTSIPTRSPRSFDEKDASPPRPRNSQEGRRASGNASPSTQSKSQSSSLSKAATAAPVTIPSRKTSLQAAGQTPSSSASTNSNVAQRPPPMAPKKIAPLDVTSLLAATSIPKRKTKGRPSQRLPEGDHVADFSRLLLDDVKSTEASSLSSSMSNPHFDGLFGNLDEVVEDGMIVGSQGLSSSVLSKRTISSESMPSLADDSTATSVNEMASPWSEKRSASSRIHRQLSSSLDCVEDHPLIHSELEIPDLPELETSRSVTPVKLPSRPTLPKARTSTFRSNLTASLRALKSAAQSVTSIAANPVLPPEDFLTSSVFSFKPELTDDKRPPPSEGQPSPALRRYLNPPHTEPGSPSELHAWHEHWSSDHMPVSLRHATDTRSPHSKSGPMTIPLQTCIPSGIRTPTASSPPVWLSADGQPTNRNTAGSLSLGSSLARQREPRENADFLRILVAEMNMRKAGKFSEQAESHASMWLPPRKPNETTVPTGQERWTVSTVP